jgi:hypothetical protein
VKERKGPFGLIVGGVVDSVVQTARRRAQDREPRAVIYDAAGRARLLTADDDGREALIVTAGRLIELAAPPPRAAEEADEAADAEAAEAESQTEAAAEGSTADGDPLP